MVASKCWPLGKIRPSMRLEMVKLPIFSEEAGVPFPRFDIKLAVDETTEEFTAIVEQETREILGDVSEKEYLVRRVIAGTMPRLNCVFEEFGIHHEEHKVLAKVLKAIEDKENKVTLKNATAVAEAKKRKGAGQGKTISKKRKVGATSAIASAGSAEEVEESRAGAVPSMAEEEEETEASAAHGNEDLMGSSLQGLSGAPAVGASHMAPMPSVLSEDSSSSEDDNSDAGLASASDSEEVASGRHD
jgi:hypothetical protein